MTPLNEKYQHQLKIFPKYYHRILSGEKTFEVRKNDRDFQTGDRVCLNEWDPETKQYTGSEVHLTITYVLHGGQFGIKKGYCVFGFEVFLNIKVNKNE